MDDRSHSSQDRPADFERRSALYRIKVELRREERAGRADSLHAEALRHVLRAFCNHDPERALDVLHREMESFQKRGDMETERALRNAVAVVSTEGRGIRKLFSFYLKKLESDGRGDEPFARAIRKTLQSPGKASLDELYVWKDGEDEPG